MELIEVHLRGVPLDTHQRAVEHSADVMREFSHLMEDPGSSHAPARLIALDRALQEKFGPFTQSTSSEIDQAIARGQTTVDITFRVPAEAGQAARDVAVLWDEVDGYCDAGEYLLALRSPPEVVAYRRWFLEQFSAQCAGEAPQTWQAWVEMSRIR